MESVFKIFLILHIVAGTTGLITGPISMLVQKGSRVHILSGLIFYYAMIIVSTSSFVLASLHNIPFLFAVGVFTAYLTLTGRRFMTQMQRGKPNQTGNYEIVIAVLTGIAGLYFLSYGIYLLVHQYIFGLVFLGFSVGITLFLLTDYKHIVLKNVSKLFWLSQHISRMMGAMIASFTAFAVVNSTGRLSLLAWFGPTVVVVPFIILWLKRIKKEPVNTLMVFSKKRVAQKTS